MFEVYEEIIDLLSAVVSLVFLIMFIRTIRDMKLPMKQHAQRMLLIAFGLFATTNVMAAIALYVELDILELIKDIIEVAFFIALILAVFLLREAENKEVVTLQRLANTDPLTKLFNQGHFIQAAQKRLELALQQKAVVSIIFLDIDDFKSYNDAFGHEDANIVLRSLAKIFDACVRDEDLLARYGGEEFVIMCLGAKAGIEIAHRIRNEVYEQCRPDKNNQLKRAVTVSIGVVSRTAEPEDKPIVLEELIRIADKEMYIAKKLGKNRVSVLNDR